MKLVNRAVPHMIYNAVSLRVHAIVRNSLVLAITLGMLALSPLCRAQNEEPSIDSTIEIVRAGMQADKATIISSTMNFSDKDGAAFWPIYRQYERERATVDDGRVAVIKEYTEKYPHLTDGDAKAMAEHMFEYDARIAALKKTYFKKFAKVLSAFTVAEFFQVERRVDLLMDMKVESALPPLMLSRSVAPENTAENAH